MGAMRVSKDLVPIARFKAKASELVRQLRRRKRPFVITLNGRAAAVVLSPEEFDRLAEDARFVDAVREGLEDSEAGRVIPDDELDLDDSSDRRCRRCTGRSVRTGIYVRSADSSRVITPSPPGGGSAGCESGREPRRP